MVGACKYTRPPFRGHKLLKDSAAQEQMGTNAAFVFECTLEVSF